MIENLDEAARQWQSALSPTSPPPVPRIGNFGHANIGWMADVARHRLCYDVTTD